MIIRDATPDDAAGAARVQVLTWQTAYRSFVEDTYLDSMDITDRAERFQKYIRELQPKNCCLVAVINNEIVGFVSGGRELENMGDFSSELHGVYVLPTHQHRGIGRALMLSFAQRMHTLQANDMVIWTLKEGPSHPFYLSTGGLLLPQTKPHEIGERSYTLNAYHYPSLTELIARLEAAKA